MFRYLFLGLLVTTGLVGGQLYVNQKDVQSASSDGISIADLTQTPPNNKNSDRANEAMTAVTAPPENGHSAAAPIANNETLFENNTESPLPRPWTQHETAPEMPTKYANRGYDARPLKINKQQLARASRGDLITLSIPQNDQDYEMAVEQVGRHANGDKSLKGHLLKNPEYTVVMTEGRTATFATINTPDGSFLLEASGDEGWMLSLAELDNLVDPNLVDYQIPEITR